MSPHPRGEEAGVFIHQLPNNLYMNATSAGIILSTFPAGTMPKAGMLPWTKQS